MPVIQSSPYTNYYNQYNTQSPALSAKAAASGGASVPHSPAEAIKLSNDPGSFNNPEIRQLKKTGAIECETCKNRKYQDGSNDPGVSFKAPTHVSPEASGAAVMSHEMEHVAREQAKAASEGRKVVSQNVRTYTDVCPECGKVYTAGGVTETVTKSDNIKDFFMDNMKKSMGKYFGGKIDVRI